MADLVQRMLLRARGARHLCAFCGAAKKDHDVDLTTFDDDLQVVVSETVPLCNACLVNYLAFAGDEALITFGKKGST